MRQSTDETQPGLLFSKGGGRFLVLFGLALAVFWPALDNGFISDDYLVLERAGNLLSHPFSLYQVPPENFRTTTYVTFLVLKTLFGYHAWVFYLFALTLHAVNAWLLARLVGFLWEKPDLGFLTAVLFVTFQNPQEAVFWLSGMNEAWVGFFILVCLICWVEHRARWSLAAYCGALFSKESAVVALPLLPLVDYWRLGRVRWRRKWVLFAIPTVLFAILFWALLDKNSLVAAGLHGFTPAAADVLLNSLNRLCKPWIYLLAAVFIMDSRRRKPPPLLAPAAWMGIALIPYLFLTYQDHVPSRQEYLACMGAAALMAALLASLSNRGLRKFLLVAFILGNAGYVCWVKDPQFDERAAPTRQLVAYLRANRPSRLRIEGYPFNPWTAKLTTRLVAGWEPEMIVVDEAEESCPECLVLRWDGERLRPR